MFVPYGAVVCHHGMILITQLPMFACHCGSGYLQRKKPPLLAALYGMVKRERRTNLAIRSRFVTMYNVHSFYHCATIAWGYSLDFNEIGDNEWISAHYLVFKPCDVWITRYMHSGIWTPLAPLPSSVTTLFLASLIVNFVLSNSASKYVCSQEILI